jgi:hypothetical protein
MLSESGNWVKKSLTWRTIDRMARQYDIDRRHQEWFTQLAGLRTRGKTDFTPDGAPYHLGDFHTPLLWDHLELGTSLGIEFVGINPGMDVRIGHRAKAAIDIRRRRGQLRVQLRTTIDERSFAPGLIKPIWTHGFFGVDVDLRVHGHSGPGRISDEGTRAARAPGRPDRSRSPTPRPRSSSRSTIPSCAPAPRSSAPMTP